MSHNWYLLAFGVELGPMSWDDLLHRASRGDLRRDSQIRRGESGPFVPAGDVPGLLGPSGDQPPESAWFCEVLGTELGPMSWKELSLLAERGTLRGDARVRCGGGQWVEASSVGGLVQRPEGAAAHLGGPPNVAPLRETTSVRGTEGDKGVPPTIAHDRSEQPSESSEPVKQASVAMTKTAASPAAPTFSAPLAAVHPGANPKPAAVPKKAVKNVSPRSTPRPPVAFQFPVRPLAVVAGILLVACGGYFGFARLKSRSARPDFQQVAVLYQQTYEQIKQFRGHPQKQSPTGLQFQVSRTVSALRTQLNRLPGDSSAGRLAEAATQLEQMLADCQAAADSAEASRFAHSEQRFLALLDSLKEQR
jgi:hypothetical protein